MKEFDRIITASVVIFIASLIFIVPGVMGQESELLFRTQFSSLAIQTSKYTSTGASPDDHLEISLPGRLYEPQIELAEIKKQDTDRSSPESAERAFYSANRKGDEQWILDCWVREEQAEIQSFLTEYLKQNTEIFEKIHQSYVTGRAELMGYTILFVHNMYADGRESKLAHTYKKTEEGWKITNALSADETFDVVYSALRSGNISARQM